MYGARLMVTFMILTLAGSQGVSRPTGGTKRPEGLKKPARQLEVQTGRATFVCAALDGSVGANGRRFYNKELVAAHPSLAFGTYVRVTNVKNRKTVTVRITDRGPTKTCQRAGVVIDLSFAAAQRLGFATDGTGTAPVRLEVIRRGRSSRRVGAVQRCAR